MTQDLLKQFATAKIYINIMLPNSEPYNISQ